MSVGMESQAWHVVGCSTSGGKAVGGRLLKFSFLGIAIGVALRLILIALQSGQ